MYTLLSLVQPVIMISFISLGLYISVKGEAEKRKLAKIRLLESQLRLKSIKNKTRK